MLNFFQAIFIVVHIIDTSMDLSLNVTMVNQLLRRLSDNVTVRLQWPREPGAVYHVSVSPEISHTELTSIMHNNVIFTINLTISYNIQYNVSIVSSLCGVTTTKVLSIIMEIDTDNNYRKFLS